MTKRECKLCEHYEAETKYCNERHQNKSSGYSLNCRSYEPIEVKKTTCMDCIYFCGQGEKCRTLKDEDYNTSVAKSIKVKCSRFKYAVRGCEVCKLSGRNSGMVCYFRSDCNETDGWQKWEQYVPSVEKEKITTCKDCRYFNGQSEHCKPTTPDGYTYSIADDINLKCGQFKVFEDKITTCKDCMYFRGKKKSCKPTKAGGMTANNIFKKCGSFKEEKPSKNIVRKCYRCKHDNPLSETCHEDWSRKIPLSTSTWAERCSSYELRNICKSCWKKDKCTIEPTTFNYCGTYQVYYSTDDEKYCMTCDKYPCETNKKFSKVVSCRGHTELNRRCKNCIWGGDECRHDAEYIIDKSEYAGGWAEECNGYQHFTTKTCSDCKHANRNNPQRMFGCKPSTGCNGNDKWEKYDGRKSSLTVQCKDCTHCKEIDQCTQYNFIVRNRVFHHCLYFSRKKEYKDPLKRVGIMDVKKMADRDAKRNNPYVEARVKVKDTSKRIDTNPEIKGMFQPGESVGFAVDVSHMAWGYEEWKSRKKTEKISMEKTETELEGYTRRYKDEIVRRVKLMSIIYPLDPEDFDKRYFGVIKTKSSGYGSMRYYGFTKEFVEYLELDKLCRKFLRKLKITVDTDYSGKIYVQKFLMKYKGNDVENIDKRDEWKIFEGILELAILKKEDFLLSRAKKKLCDLTDCFKQPKKNECLDCGTKNKKQAIYCCSCGAQLKPRPQLYR